MAKVKLEDLKYVGTATQQEQDTVEEVVETAEPVVEEPDLNEESEFENAQQPVVEVVEKQMLNVRKLRIYSIPSTKVPARSFSGNIVIVGHIDKFAVVEYVRSGFGKVKGYVIDTELPR